MLNTLLIILSAIIICLFLVILYIFKKNNHKMHMELINTHRKFNQHINILNTIVNGLTSDLPLHNHPMEKEKQIVKELKHSMQKFSQDISENIQQIVSSENDLWNDKFSILLDTLGKSESELQEKRDDLFKESWTSISKLRKQSVLLFHDMKEDGTFFRMQSLYTLSQLCFSEQKYETTFRHIIAALKLYSDTQPTLPLSHHIAWDLGELLYQCSLHLDRDYQTHILKKFNISGDEIVSHLSNSQNYEEHIETLQLLRIWESQISNFV